MSTKGTVAGAEEIYVVGGEVFNASIHFFEECFDEDPKPLHIRLWQEGVFDNHTTNMTLPRDEAIQMATALGEWAKRATAAKGE